MNKIKEAAQTKRLLTLLKDRLNDDERLNKLVNSFKKGELSINGSTFHAINLLLDHLEA